MTEHEVQGYSGHIREVKALLRHAYVLRSCASNFSEISVKLTSTCNASLSLKLVLPLSGKAIHYKSISKQMQLKTSE